MDIFAPKPPRLLGGTREVAADAPPLPRAGVGPEYGRHCSMHPAPIICGPSPQVAVYRLKALFGGFRAWTLPSREFFHRGAQMKQARNASFFRIPNKARVKKRFGVHRASTFRARSQVADRLGIWRDASVHVCRGWCFSTEKRITWWISTGSLGCLGTEGAYPGRANRRETFCHGLSRIGNAQTLDWHVACDT
jgi:hypothetical protein